MIGSDKSTQVKSYIGNFVAEKPTQTQERRGISHDLFCLGDGAVPVGLLVGGDLSPEAVEPLGIPWFGVGEQIVPAEEQR